MTKQFSSLAFSVFCTVATACHLDQGGSQKSAKPANVSGPGADSGQASDAGRPGGGGRSDAAGQGVEDAGGPQNEAGPGSAFEAGVLCSGDPLDPLCAFQAKRKISFDATKLAQPLVDFPVLVTLDPSRIDYSKAQPDGHDLRFVDSDGTTWLAHEIERWQMGGTSSIWVKVPHFAPGEVHDIYMIYGSDNTPLDHHAQAVFSADYAAVYHLSDDLSGHLVRDSLGQQHGMVAPSMSASDSVAARVGNGLTFDGADHRVQLGGLDMSGWTAFTLEAWVLQQEDVDARILCQADSSEAQEHVACLGVAGDKLRVFLSTQGEEGRAESYDAPGASTGSWSHLAVAWDAQSHELRVLRNGFLVRTFKHEGARLGDSALPLILGSLDVNDERILNGVVDEVRISSVARSSLWLQATVAAINESITTYGPEQPFLP